MNKQSERGEQFAWIIGIALLTYLLCPMLFIAPLIAADKAGLAPRALMKTAEFFFKPLQIIGNKIPPYRALIEKEASFCQMLGIIPRQST